MALRYHRLPPDRRRAPAHDRRARALRRPDLPHQQLADLLYTAFFSPSEDCDADSWSTQEERFNEQALALALTTLVSEAEAHRQTLIDAVHREITWRLGPGEDLQITIRNRQISIEPAPDPAP